jgi:hypothetical protein
MDGRGDMKYVLGTDGTLLIFDVDYIHSYMAERHNLYKDKIKYAGFLSVNKGDINIFGKSNSLEKKSPDSLYEKNKIIQQIKDNHFILQLKKEYQLEDLNGSQDLLKDGRLTRDFFVKRHVNTDNSSYDWMISIPENIDIQESNLITVKLLASELQNDHYNYSPSQRKEAMYSDWMAGEAGLISLTIFTVEKEGHENAYQFDHMFTSSNPFYKDAHLKISEIIDTAIDELESYGVSVNHKVVVEGFSGEGVFAHKMAVLLPEKVYAIVAGQCGGYLTKLPNTSKSNVYDWPYGMKNVNQPFNKEAFNQVHKFIYCGTLDNQCSYIVDTGDRNWIEGNHYRNLGETDPQRLHALIKEAQAKGYENYYFKAFNNVTHDRPDDYIIQVLEELKSEQNNPDLTQFASSEEEISAIPYTQISNRVLHKFDHLDFYDQRNEDYLVKAYNLEEKITISDPILKNKIAELVGKDSSKQLYYKDVYKIRALELYNHDVSSLDGIRYLNNLQVLRLEHNKVSDFSELKYLTQMVKLDISGQNQSTSGLNSISEMKNLVYLRANNLNINSIDFLNTLEYITTFEAYDNNISDVSVLEKYTDMIRLRLGGNPIKDVPFIDRMPYVSHY